MIKPIPYIVGALLAAASLTGPAQATSEGRARAEIAHAEADLEAAADAGALVNAADVQAHGMAALERARHHLATGNERRAYYAAREADALAGLAAATAAYRSGSNRG